MSFPARPLLDTFCYPLRKVQKIRQIPPLPQFCPVWPPQRRRKSGGYGRHCFRLCNKGAGLRPGNGKTHRIVSANPPGRSAHAAVNPVGHFRRISRRAFARGHQSPRESRTGAISATVNILERLIKAESRRQAPHNSGGAAMILSFLRKVVPEVRFELTHLAAEDFESPASTVPPLGHRAGFSPPPGGRQPAKRVRAGAPRRYRIAPCRRFHSRARTSVRAAPTCHG